MRTHTSRPAGCALRKDLNGELMNQTPDRARSLGTSSTTELRCLCRRADWLDPKLPAMLLPACKENCAGATWIHGSDREERTFQRSLSHVSQQVCVIMISWTKGFQGALQHFIHQSQKTQRWKHFNKVCSQTSGGKSEFSSPLQTLQHGAGILQTSERLLLLAGNCSDNVDHSCDEDLKQ